MPCLWAALVRFSAKWVSRAPWVARELSSIARVIQRLLRRQELQLLHILDPHIEPLAQLTAHHQELSFLPL